MRKRLIRLVACATLAVMMASIVAVSAQCANLPVPAPARNDGTMVGIDIGNDIPKMYNVGGGIVGVQAVYYCDHYEHCHNVYYRGCNQYLATGTNSDGSSLPYSKISTTGPGARAILTRSAQSLGLVPGGTFGVEIGTFMNYIGYTPCTRLNIPMHYDVYVNPAGTTVPVMLALLPNGTVTLLGNAEFDTVNSLWYANGTRMYRIHTMYPEAVYMLAYPAK